MNKTLSVFSAACLSLVLSGCAVHGQVDKQMVAEPDPLSLRLAAAVDKASSALETLASVEQARNPGAAIQSVPYAPQELRRTITVNWNGPIEPILQHIADRAGYEVQVNGDVPPAPVVVTLTARQKMVIDVLRDLGLQAGRRADVVVDPERHVVELNYAPVSGD